MVKKTFMAACFGAGLAVMALASIVTQAQMDEPAAALPVVQLDTYALTLKAHNLPVQTIEHPI